MKHIFTVELTEEDGLDRLKTYAQAESYRAAVEDWFTETRKILKYGSDAETEVLRPGLEKAREMLMELLRELNE